MGTTCNAPLRNLSWGPPSPADAPGQFQIAHFHGAGLIFFQFDYLAIPPLPPGTGDPIDALPACNIPGGHPGAPRRVQRHPVCRFDRLHCDIAHRLCVDTHRRFVRLRGIRFALRPVSVVLFSAKISPQCLRDSGIDFQRAHVIVGTLKICEIVIKLQGAGVFWRRVIIRRYSSGKFGDSAGIVPV